jgi:hypothetical protein
MPLSYELALQLGRGISRTMAPFATTPFLTQQCGAAISKHIVQARAHCRYREESDVVSRGLPLLGGGSMLALKLQSPWVCHTARSMSGLLETRCSHCFITFASPEG